MALVLRLRARWVVVDADVLSIAITMQTYPTMDKHGLHPLAFEIENVYVGPRAIGRILEQVNGVSGVRVRRAFSKWEDVHVWFKYMDRDYVVVEPFGDNSRYWIGPKEAPENAPDVGAVENAFKDYRPPLHREIFGDVLTLRLFKRLIGRA